jgi:type IV secretory pathway VirB10-like protein
LDAIVLVGRGHIETLISTVEPVRFIRSGIAASVLAHLSILALVLIFAEVHPFGSVTAEPIAVDIVTPAQVEEKKTEPPEPPKAEPSDAFDLSSQSASPNSPPAAAPPPKQATPAAPRSPQQQAAAQPQPPSTSPVPAYIPPEPDLSIKYHVMLGLPQDLPPIATQVRSGDGGDNAASKAADVASSLVTEFRRHLKTCLKLPESIAPSDKLRIVLRTLMTPEGKLATEPVLIEASASPKGPALMQSAIDALQSCQPYAMLPQDRYGEWKVLDLSFTPEDFTGG